MGDTKPGVVCVMISLFALISHDICHNTYIVISRADVSVLDLQSPCAYRRPLSGTGYELRSFSF